MISQDQQGTDTHSQSPSGHRTVGCSFWFNRTEASFSGLRKGSLCSETMKNCRMTKAVTNSVALFACLASFQVILLIAPGACCENCCETAQRCVIAERPEHAACCDACPFCECCPLHRMEFRCIAVCNEPNNECGDQTANVFSPKSEYPCRHGMALDSPSDGGSTVCSLQMCARLSRWRL
jgi:hypothetical protein